jgi:hypothetical protein
MNESQSAVAHRIDQDLRRDDAWMRPPWTAIGGGGGAAADQATIGRCRWQEMKAAKEGRNRPGEEGQQSRPLRPAAGRATTRGSREPHGIWTIHIGAPVADDAVTLID